MRGISYFMIIIGLSIVVGAFLTAETDSVQVMFGTFLCIGGYFILKEQG